MSRSPRITACTWALPPASWSADPRWIAEWMTIEGEHWFTRIARGTEPSMPPVVMVHGVIISGTYFRPVANLLDTRYTTYVPDLPGIGRKRSKTRWTLPMWAEHLARWMDAHDLTGAVIVGNSFGCQITTLLAMTRPDLVRAQVLIAPTLDPKITSVPGVIWKSALVFPREHISIWATWIPDFFRTGPLRSLRMVRQMFQDDQLARLGDIRQPSLVIGGAWDTVSPPSWIRQVVAHIPHSHAMIIPNAPHALNYSRPQDLVDAIEQTIMLAAADNPCL